MHHNLCPQSPTSCSSSSSSSFCAKHTRCGGLEDGEGGLADSPTGMSFIPLRLLGLVVVVVDQ